MELPIELKQKIENLAHNTTQSKLKQCVEVMSNKYRDESGQGKKLVSEDIQILAYALTRMPATFGAICKALEEIPGRISTVLDVGAGMGTATWAIHESFNIDHFTCLERIDAMVSLGKTLMKDSELEDKVTWIKEDMNIFQTQDRYDLVIASYSLNELSDEKRNEIVEKLWHYTNKYLVIVEPGTPKAFIHMRQIKDLIVSLGGYVLGPCPHHYTCPLENDWCHFTCRISRSKLHMYLKGGTVPYEDEKFSYFVFSKEKTNNNISRILRHPQIESGRISLELCTKDGLKTQIITKKDKQNFKKARKANAGDTFG